MFSVRFSGLEFDITLEAFEWMHQQPCHWCGAPLAETGSGLDRLDNNRGYVPGNVVQACDVCNLLRGRRFRPDLMAVIGAGRHDGYGPAAEFTPLLGRH
jgi:hypothetical protein